MGEQRTIVHKSPPRSPTRSPAHEAPRARALTYLCRGPGLRTATVREQSEFTVEALDADGQKVTQQGTMALFVSIHGVSRVRAWVVDNVDGSVTIRWKPPQSGRYTIAISDFGIALPESPFVCEAMPPEPWAANCILQGDALTSGVARDTNSFNIAFKDRLGATTTAVELDVFVEPVSASSPRAHNAKAGGRANDVSQDLGVSKKLALPIPETIPEDSDATMPEDPMSPPMFQEDAALPSPPSDPLLAWEESPTNQEASPTTQEVSPCSFSYPKFSKA